MRAATGSIMGGAIAAHTGSALGAGRSTAPPLPYVNAATKAARMPTTRRATAIAIGSVTSLGDWTTRTLSAAPTESLQSETKMAESNAWPVSYGCLSRGTSHHMARPLIYSKFDAEHVSTLPATSPNTNSSPRILPGSCKSKAISARSATPTLAGATSLTMTTHAAPERSHAGLVFGDSFAMGATLGLVHSGIQPPPCAAQSNTSKAVIRPAQLLAKTAGPDESWGLRRVHLRKARWYIDREIQKREAVNVAK